MKDEEEDSDLNPHNRFLEGLDIVGWVGDRFLKQYAGDDELIDF